MVFLPRKYHYGREANRSRGRIRFIPGVILAIPIASDMTF
jgi:hypothetical protein